MANNYIEGYVNQLYEKIINALNRSIINNYRDIFLDEADDKSESEDNQIHAVLRKKIEEILIKYEVIRPDELYKPTLPMIMPPSDKKIDALRKQRLYRVNKLKKIYEAEKSQYLSEDKECNVTTTPLTPYGIIHLTVKCNNTSLEQLVSEYDNAFYGWHKRTKQKDFKNPSSKAYFFDYPYIGLLDNNQKRILCDIDLEYNILYAIEYENLVNFVQLKPLSTVQAGLYRKSGQKSKNSSFELSEADAGEYMAAFTDFVAHMEENTTYISNWSPFVMDEKGSRLMNYFMTACFKRYKLFGNSMIMDTMGSIVKILYPEVERPGAKYYGYATAYLLNLQSQGLMRKSKKGTFSKVGVKGIFEELELITDDETGNVVSFKISLNQAFIREMLNMNVSTILTTTINQLSGDIARLLYQDMKTDRLCDVMNINNNSGATHYYDVKAFMFMINVPGRKSVKMKAYKEALMEMQEKGVLVQEWRELGDGFEIKWLPLTKTEYDDVMDRDKIISVENLALESVNATMLLEN